MQQWNLVDSTDYQSFTPRVQFNQTLIPIEPSQDYTGDAYPLRDSCKRKGDPEVLNGTVFYYDAQYPMPSAPFQLTLSTVKNASVLLSQEIPPEFQLALRKSAIHCEGGSECGSLSVFTCSAVCEKECTKRNGKWSTATSLCTLTIYLQSICLRVVHKNGKWAVDGGLKVVCCK